MFVQEFQDQLHTTPNLAHDSESTVKDPFGVIYTVADSCERQDLAKWNLVMVKTTCTPRTSVTSSPKLEIVVFWWDAKTYKPDLPDNGHIWQRADLTDFVVLNQGQRRRRLQQLYA